MTSSNETALEGIALDPVQAYLASLGMTAGELLIGNLALAVTGMAALTFGLQVAEKALTWVAKKRGADLFNIPVAWRFPVSQIMVFFMIYPGCVQTCLTVIQSECTTWPYPVLAGFTIVGISLLLARLARMVMTGRFQVPFHETHDDHDESEGKHALFIVKTEQHESASRRYFQLFTRCDRTEHGEWAANSSTGEVLMCEFSGLFKKFGPTGIIFYFGDAGRKLLLMVIIALTTKHGGAIQGMVAMLFSVGQWIYILMHLPYNKMSDNMCELVVMFGQTVTLFIPLLGRLGVLSWPDVSNQMISTMTLTTFFNIARLSTGMPVALLGVAKYLGGAKTIAAAISRSTAKAEPVIRRQVKQQLDKVLPTYTKAFRTAYAMQLDEAKRRGEPLSSSSVLARSHAAGMEAVSAEFGLRDTPKVAAVLVVIEFVSAEVAETFAQHVVMVIQPQLAEELKEGLFYTRIPCVQRIVLASAARQTHRAVSVAIRQVVNGAVEKAMVSALNSSGIDQETTTVDDPETVKLLALFDRYDLNKNGTLEVDELEFMLTKLNKNTAHLYALKLQSEFGDVHVGQVPSISFDSFKHLIAALEKPGADGAQKKTRRMMLSKLAPRAVDRLAIASCDHEQQRLGGGRPSSRFMDRDERVEIVHDHDTRVPRYDHDTETANVQEVELELQIYLCPSPDGPVCDGPGRSRGSRNDAAGAEEIGLYIFCANESADASSSDAAVANLDEFFC